MKLRPRQLLAQFALAAALVGGSAILISHDKAPEPQGSTSSTPVTDDSLRPNEAPTRAQKLVAIAAGVYCWYVASGAADRRRSGRRGPNPPAA